MRAIRLISQLTFFYVFGMVVIAAGLWLVPSAVNYLPVGGVETLLTQPSRGLLEGIEVRPARVDGLGGSLAWLAIAIAGALLTALPVSWVYMEIRDPEEYDQSLIGTIVMLPVVVTGVVIIVQNSLALAFSLAGIAGAVRFRNSLKSTGDALFILLAVGIGLAAGIGALELSAVMSVAFNYCFLGLWLSKYGERKLMKRYMSDVDWQEGDPLGPDPAPAPTPTEAGQPSHVPPPLGAPAMVSPPLPAVAAAPAAAPPAVGAPALAQSPLPAGPTAPAVS